MTAQLNNAWNYWPSYMAEKLAAQIPDHWSVTSAELKPHFLYWGGQHLLSRSMLMSSVLPNPIETFCDQCVAKCLLDMQQACEENGYRLMDNRQARFNIVHTAEDDTIKVTWGFAVVPGSPFHELSRYMEKAVQP